MTELQARHPRRASIVTIHQPNFLPWLGYFDKIRRADTFVVLDHTENNPRQASFWGRRVRVLAGGRPHWLSIPLVKPGDGRVGLPIHEMRIAADIDRLAHRHLRLLEQSYARAPHRDAVLPLVEDYYGEADDRLVERNLRFIERVLERLGSRPRILRSSTLGCTRHATDLLVEIVGCVGGGTYLCGAGAGLYQDDALFAAASIELRHNNFRHPVYPQGNAARASFHAGLSVIDALMHVGFDGVRELLDR